MSWITRREIPMFVCSFIALIIIFEFFLKIPQLTSLSKTIQSLALILLAFALGLGMINVTIIHWRNVTQRMGPWYLSAWLLLIMFFTFLIGAIGTPSHPVFQWLFMNVYTPLGSTVYAMLGFFVLSAAYRVYRARNWSAAILLTTSVFIMLKNAPIGGALWLGFESIGSWINEVIVVGGTRAIQIGVGLGIIAMSIGIIIGYEKGYWGGE